MTEMDALVADVDGTYINTLGFIYEAHYLSAKKFLESHPVPEDHNMTFEVFVDVLKEYLHVSPKKRSEEVLRKIFASNPELIEGMNFDTLFAMLLEIESEIAEESIKPYENLHPTLQKVGETGIKHAIWTSANRSQVVRSFSIALPEIELQGLHKDPRDDDKKVDILTKAIAKTYSIPGFIIITSDDVYEAKGKNKPDPKGFGLAMERLDAQPGRSIMLGDHIADMQASESAGAAVRIGITHGSHDGEMLRAHGATAIINSLEELPALL